MHARLPGRQHLSSPLFAAWHQRSRRLATCIQRTLLTQPGCLLYQHRHSLLEIVAPNTQADNPHDQQQQGCHQL